MSCFKKILDLTDNSKKALNSTLTGLKAIASALSSSANAVYAIAKVVTIIAKILVMVSSLLEGISQAITKTVKGSTPVAVAIRSGGRLAAKCAQKGRRVSQQLENSIGRSSKRMRDKYIKRAAAVNKILAKLTPKVKFILLIIQTLELLIQLLRKNNFCKSKKVKERLKKIENSQEFILALKALKNINKAIADINAKKKEIETKLAQVKKLGGDLDAIAQKIGKPADRLKENLKDQEKYIKDLEKKVQDKLDEIEKKMKKSTLGKITLAGIKLLGKALDTVEGWITTIINGVDFLIGKDLAQALSNTLQETKKPVREIEKLVKEIQALVNDIDALVEPILAEVEKISEAIVYILYELDGPKLDKILSYKKLPKLLKKVIFALQKQKEKMDKLKNKKSKSAIKNASSETMPTIKYVAEELNNLNKTSREYVFGKELFEYVESKAPALLELTYSLENLINETDDFETITHHVIMLEEGFSDLDYKTRSFLAQWPQHNDEYFMQLAQIKPPSSEELFIDLPLLEEDFFELAEQ